MNVYVFKQKGYLGIFERGSYVPVYANSLVELKDKLLVEIYRYSAFNDKKVPKDTSIQIVKTISLSQDKEVFNEENISLLGVTKKDFEDVKTMVIQTAFSYKSMVEPISQISVKELFNFVSVPALDEDIQIIEYAFNLVEYASSLSLNGGYAYLLKAYYNLTKKAEEFYYANADKKPCNLFYFGIWEKRLQNFAIALSIYLIIYSF